MATMEPPEPVERQERRVLTERRVLQERAG